MSETPTERENPRKIREGIVASTKMDKTVVVVATDRVRHRRYNKTVQRDKRLYVHDEENDANVGDRAGAWSKSLSVRAKRLGIQRNTQ